MAMNAEAEEEFMLEEFLQKRFDDGRQKFHITMNMIKQEFRPSSRTVLAQV